MKVDGQSYDSMRYELGVDAGYTFTYSEDQALTPYFKLALRLRRLQQRC